MKLKNLSTENGQYLKVMSLRKGKKSRKDLTQDLSVPPSFHLILIRYSFSRKVAGKKPLLKKRNREKRLRYAKSDRNTLKINGNTSYGDEYKFKDFCSNCHHYVQGKSEKRYMCLQLSVKYGDGFVMV